MKKVLIFIVFIILVSIGSVYPQIFTSLISDVDRDLCIIDHDMRLRGTYDAASSVADSLALANGGTKLDTILVRIPTTNLYYTNKSDSVTTQLTIFSYFDSSSTSADSFCGKLPGIVGEWAVYPIGTNSFMGDSSSTATGWSSLAWYVFNDSLTYGVINIDKIALGRPCEEMFIRYRKTSADTGTIKYSTYVDLYTRVEGIKLYDGHLNRIPNRNR